MVPTENVTLLGPIDPDKAIQWCALGTLLVPFGGLLAAGLQAGETLLMHGATGNFGSAGVAVSPWLWPWVHGAWSHQDAIAGCSTSSCAASAIESAR
jgi:NADPH:quinone reductase-like Zn-dependent oxidoreductase